MKHIFSSLLKNKFSDQSLEMKTLINAISLGCLDAIKAANTLFFPTPSRLHYLFNIHDIKKVHFFISCIKFLLLFTIIYIRKNILSFMNAFEAMYNILLLLHKNKT